MAATIVLSTGFVGFFPVGEQSLGQYKLIGKVPHGNHQGYVDKYVLKKLHLFEGLISDECRNISK